MQCTVNISYLKYKRETIKQRKVRLNVPGPVGFSYLPFLKREGRWVLSYRTPSRGRGLKTQTVEGLLDPSFTTFLIKTLFVDTKFLRWTLLPVSWSDHSLDSKGRSEPKVHRHIRTIRKLLVPRRREYIYFLKDLLLCVYRFPVILFSLFLIWKVYLFPSRLILSQSM